MNFESTPSTISFVVGKRGSGKTAFTKSLLSKNHSKDTVITLSSFLEATEFAGGYTNNCKLEIDTPEKFLSDPFGYCIELDKRMDDAAGFALVFDDVTEMNHRKHYNLDGGQSPFAALLRLTQLSNAKRRRLSVIIVAQLLPNIPAYIRSEIDAVYFSRYSVSQTERKFYSHARPQQDLRKYTPHDPDRFYWWGMKSNSFLLYRYVLTPDGQSGSMFELDATFDMEPHEMPEPEGSDVITIPANIELRIDLKKRKVTGIYLID